MNIALDFITQPYFPLADNSRLDYIHYFIMKRSNKCDLLQIAINDSPDTYFKYFMKL